MGVSCRHRRPCAASQRTRCASKALNADLPAPAAERSCADLTPPFCCTRSCRCTGEATGGRLTMPAGRSSLPSASKQQQPNCLGSGPGVCYLHTAWVPHCTRSSSSRFGSHLSISGALIACLVHCVQVLWPNGHASRVPGSQPGLHRAVHAGTQQTVSQGVQATSVNDEHSCLQQQQRAFSFNQASRRHAGEQGPTAGTAGTAQQVDVPACAGLDLSTGCQLAAHHSSELLLPWLVCQALAM